MRTIKIDDNTYIEVESDPYADSPNEYCDKESLFFASDHRHMRVNVADYRKMFTSIETQKELTDKFHVYPITAYIHSGIVLYMENENTNECRWDTTKNFGFVFVSKKQWPEFDDAYKIAKAHIDEYNMYLSGDVYTARLYTNTTCSHCGHVHKELIDSVSGIYGNVSDEEIKSYF